MSRSTRGTIQTVVSPGEETRSPLRKSPKKERNKGCSAMGHSRLKLSDLGSKWHSADWGTMPVSAPLLTPQPGDGAGGRLPGGGA